MKKAMKRLGIISGILTALGLVLIIAGSIMGGAGYIAGDVANNRLVVGIKDKIFLDYDQVDTSHMNTITEGEIQFQADKVNSLCLYGKYGEYEVNEGMEDSYYIQCGDGADHVKYSLENGELKIAITGTISKFWRKNIKVKIYIPKDTTMDCLKLDVGAGTMKCSNIKTNQLDVIIGAGEGKFANVVSGETCFNVGAGEAEITNAEFSNCDLKVGMGEITVDGNILGDMDIDCGIGSVELALTNAYTDFNYSVDVGAGEVEIGEQDYSGVGHNINLNNSAKHMMNIKCGMGEVSVDLIK